MKLEIGKTYVLNNGEKHVCDVGSDTGFAMGIYWYHEDGRCGTYDADEPLSVSHEYTQPEGKTLAKLDVKAGDVVECVKWDGDYWTNNREYKIQENNKIQNNTGSEYSISSVGRMGLWRIVSRATPQPTLWRDMTDAEKGALLLAKHEGKAIEDYTARGEWVDMDGHTFHDGRDYRIKPTPKVEAVMWCQKGVKCDHTGNTHRITFTTTDGKPDTKSIRMDEL